MVSLVPPGVGRRKRYDHDYNKTQVKTMLVANQTHLSLKKDQDLLHQRQLTELSPEFIEEIPLGIVVTMQAWHLSSILFKNETTQIQTQCTERNFCEYGQNCAVFGPGSLFTCQFGAEIMSRWLASETCQEVNYLTAFHKGSDLESCEKYNSSCPVTDWNSFITHVKKYTNEF